MRPLTDTMPKPLLSVGGMPLIERHVINLREAGITEIVVNVAYLAAQLIDWLGDGERWGIAISVSQESEPMETAGGILQALPVLGTSPFIVVNGDVYSDFDFRALLKRPPEPGAAHLVFVDNPAHRPGGDFWLQDGVVLADAADVTTPLSALQQSSASALTYSGIGCYSHEFFAGCKPGKQPLKPLMIRAMRAGQLFGEHYGGDWEDVGTPERLAILDKRIALQERRQ